jgi:tetratricopeptide (TPR) repeat protein
VTEKELPQAIPRLTQRLASNPASRAFVPLADEYLRQNLLEDAILVLNSGIEHHPTYVAARMMLGNAYQRAGRVVEARREFESVVRVHPENVLAYKKIALIYREAGQLGETVEICNKILTIDPYDKKAKGILASAQEEISAIEDRAAMPDWPQLTLLAPSDERASSDAEDFPPLPALEKVEPEETEMIERFPDLDEVQVADDILEGAIFEAEYVPVEGEYIAVPVSEELAPLAFVPKTVYNPPSLYQIRLKEWLVSIQEKGERPLRGVKI